MEGYILMHRGLFDWEWWSDEKTLKLWITILMLANYEDKEWHGMVIKRGQFVTSLDKLSQQSKLSVQSVRTSLKHLISTGEITSKSTNKYRIITVRKYEEYQDWKGFNNKQKEEELTNNQQTANKQLTNNLTTTNTLNTLNTLNTQKNNINNNNGSDFSWEKLSKKEKLEIHKIMMGE